MVIELKVVKVMADIVYRVAEKSVDDASAQYEYQPEIPEKLKHRDSCKQSQVHLLMGYKITICMVKMAKKCQ